MSPIESDQEDEIAETEESNASKFERNDVQSTKEIRKIEESIVK